MSLADGHVAIIVAGGGLSFAHVHVDAQGLESANDGLRHVVVPEIEALQPLHGRAGQESLGALVAEHPER